MNEWMKWSMKLFKDEWMNEWNEFWNYDEWMNEMSFEIVSGRMNEWNEFWNYIRMNEYKSSMFRQILDSVKADHVEPGTKDLVNEEGKREAKFFWYYMTTTTTSTSTSTSTSLSYTGINS